MLDHCLSFEENVRVVFNKLDKTIGLFGKLQCLISRFTLFMIRMKIYTKTLRIHTFTMPSCTVPQE